LAPTPRSIVVRIILAACLLASTVAGQTSQPASVKPSLQNAEPFILNVTVTEKSGSYVMGLKSDDFEVTIDNKPAPIVSLSLVDSPVSIGILLDSSGSVGGRSRQEATKTFVALREAIRHLLGSSNQANKYFLIGFNTKPQLLTDWTSDLAAIMDTFHDLRVYGNTALYDACYAAIDKLHDAPHAKRAIILVSDGQDNLSHYSFKELRDLLRESNVLLYSINLDTTSEVFGGSSLEMEGKGVLEELSFISGAKSFSEKDGAPLKLKDANALFEIIANDLRNQYTLSIVPSEPLASKKWHKIKVKVNPPRDSQPQVKGISVRVREGVYGR
jgi:Ca-activated chloride channel family protein